MLFSRTLVVAVVGVGCIAAAGTGAYLAVRSGTTAPSAATLDEVPSGGSPGASVPGQTAAGGQAFSPTSTSRSGSTSKDTAKAAAPHAQKPAGHLSPPTLSSPAAPTLAPANGGASGAAFADLGTSVSDLPAPLPEPQLPLLEQLTVPSDAVIGIRLDGQVTSATARVEDRVTATVTRDVTVEGRVAIPAGSKLEGDVTVVQHGGKFKDRARLGIRFQAAVLADNTHVPIQTETIFRDGEPPGNDAASKVGASAVIGTILGTVLGGKKGAAVGTAVGAAGGATAVASTDANEATIPAGAPLTVRLTSPVTVLVEPSR